MEASSEIIDELKVRKNCNIIHCLIIRFQIQASVTAKLKELDPDNTELGKFFHSIFMFVFLSNCYCSTCREFID